MKKITAMLVLLAVLFCLSSAALAVNEDVEGELVIYSSAYPEVLDMLDEALKKEFPNLTPGVNGSFFFYSGSGKLEITKKNIITLIALTLISAAVVVAYYLWVYKPKG